MQNGEAWNELDFDRMSWHDNHVHALRIRGREHGTGDLELDLDYILEWLQQGDSSCTFRVAPATLTFREVYDLRIEIDYKVVTAGLVPFSIAEIEREPDTNTGLSRWNIKLNWPQGQLSFAAAGFRQVLRAPAIVTGAQALTHEERTAPGA